MLKLKKKKSACKIKKSCYGEQIWQYSAYRLLIHWASHSQHRDKKSVPHLDTPFAKTRLCDDIYLDRHLLVEIHLHDKICRL